VAPDRHEHDTEATVGDEDKTKVGRMVGSDRGYVGETGAEARAAAQDQDQYQEDPA
jgi:hypothetical protein